MSLLVHHIACWWILSASFTLSKVFFPCKLSLLLWASLLISTGLLTIHDNFYDLWAVHVNHWEFKFPEVMTSHKGQKVHTGHCLYRNLHLKITRFERSKHTEWHAFKMITNCSKMYWKSSIQILICIYKFICFSFSCQLLTWERCLRHKFNERLY